MWLSRTLFVVFFFVLCAPAEALNENVSVDSLTAAIATASQNVDGEGLSAEQQETVKNQLERARSALAEAERFQNLLNQYEQDAAQAQQILNTLNKQQAEALSSVLASVRSLSVSQLANAEPVISAKLSSLQSEFAELQQQKSDLANRPSSIASEINAARESLEKTSAALDNLKRQVEPAQGEDPTNAAAKLALQAKSLSLQTQITLYEREIATVPARQSLVEAKLALSSAQIEATQQQLDYLQQRLQNVLSNKAALALQNAQQLAQTIEQPELQSAAQDNINLASTLADMAQLAPQIDENIVRLRQQRQDMQQSAQTVDRVLATGQITDELGVLLFRLRSSLPKEAPLENRLEQVDELSINQQLNLIIWQDKLRVLDELKRTQQGEQQTSQSLNKLQHELLLLLLETASSLIDKLTDEKLLLNEVLNNAQELKVLLDRRLVWLPSYTKLSDNIGRNLARSVAWYADGDAWLRLFQDMWQGIQQKPLYALLALVIFSVVVSLRRPLKKSLNVQIERIGKVERDTHWATPLALLETLILALPLPILIFSLAALISIGSESGSFSRAIATGLAAVSSLSLTLLFFRSMCRRDGMFVGHFGWSDMARDRLGHLLSWFVWYQGLATFIFASALASNKLELRYGIAIVAFMVMSCGIALFSFNFFNPKNGVVLNIVGQAKTTAKTILAFVGTVAAPLLIGLLPLIGFFDTAVELQSKLFQSGVVLIFVAIFYGILMRGFMVAYQRYLLRKEQAMQAELEQAKQNQQNAASGDAAPEFIEDQPSDQASVIKQMRSTATGVSTVLFLFGLWYIWMPLLPALGIIDEIVLWHKTANIDGIEMTVDVTLWNILLSLFFLVGGYIAAKNARGILEVSFFQQVSLDPGARYAAVTILSYVLFGTSLVLGFGQLGIDWSKLQWIVAALGVGLGFGLQEIVANFVSGLIILFERPVRVGDIVTIGNLSGTVSNIKIRATTITDFENRDVLLPNKAIITENVTNWTLHNATTRLLLKVGVAYGSDIRKVREVLMEVVEQHPDVLKTPAPSVFFMAHGESSLDFELRLFVDSTSKRLPVTHDINSQINEALGKHGFEIPFPQRDLHIISHPNTALLGSVAANPEAKPDQ